MNVNAGEQMAKSKTLGAFSPERMETAREKRKLTRRQLSDSVGVTEGTIYNWGTAKTTPDVNQAARLAEALGVDLDDLFE